MCRIHGLGVGILCLLFASGCLIVPVRTTTATRDPAGHKSKLPQLSLVPGQTTRADVEAKYSQFAVDSGIPSLFWARFSKSSWALLAGFGGYGAGSASAERVWGNQNQLVNFDPDGMLLSSEIVPDKNLSARLAALVQERRFAALELSPPITVTGQNMAGNVVDLQLSAKGMTITRFRPSRVAPKRPPLV